MWVFLQKNGSLGELRHQRFVVFLVDSVCYSFMTIKGVAHGEEYGLNSVQKRAWKCDWENNRSGLRSNQSM